MDKVRSMTKSRKNKSSLIGNIFKDFEKQRNTPNPAAFAGAKAVYQEAKQNLRGREKINYKDVVNELEVEDAYTMHRPKRNTRFPKLGYIATGIHSDWQADLADFQRLKNENKGYAFLLVCVDVLSKKIYVFPVKSKTPSNIIEAFNQIFKKANATPMRLTTDQGTEFQAKVMRDFYAKHNILKKVVYSEHHAGVAERAIRTIKTRLYRYFTYNQTNIWVDVVQKIVDSINASVNRTIGMSPNDVNIQNAKKIYDRIFRPKIEKRDERMSNLQVGDLVRLNKWKGVFGKGYTPNYTSEIFKIINVKHSYPKHYKIEDLNGERILGPYYAEDFSKVQLKPSERIGDIVDERTNRRGEKQYKIRWILTSGKYREEWINVEEAEKRFKHV